LPDPEKERYVDLYKRSNRGSVTGYEEYSKEEHGAFRSVTEELLVHARSGLVEAQARLSRLCTTNPDFQVADYGTTEEELFDLLHKAAASGSIFGEVALAYCIDRKVEGAILVKDLKPGQIASNDLRVDEMLFWYWRGAQKANWLALISLGLFAGDIGYHYPTHLEDFLDKYRWKYLADLLWVYRDRQNSRRLFDRERYQKRQKLTDEQLALGDQMIKEWLLAYPDMFQQYQEPFTCEGKDWYYNRQVKFNQAGLDKAIKVLMDRVEKASKTQH